MKNPGVYKEKASPFPNTIEKVPTAIPAFIGYTHRAEYQGKSVLHKPLLILSMEEFNDVFGFGDDDSMKQYAPHYYLVKQEKEPTKDCITLNSAFYAIHPDPGTIYYMFHSIQAFFQNGGGAAYIVSVGTCGQPTQNPLEPGAPLINPNVELKDLLAGLKKLSVESEPTMYICPEATLLNEADNQSLMNEMLHQGAKMKTTFCLFDVAEGRNPNPKSYLEGVEKFRNGLGNYNLQHGAAYYPFLETTFTNTLLYTQINGGDLKQLKDLLSPTIAPNKKAEEVIEKIANGALSELQGQAALMQASETYQKICRAVLNVVNVVPPSGFMAGIYKSVDEEKGVWYAPAGVSALGAQGLTTQLSESQLQDFYIDASSGKSINCFSHVKNQGIVVWGARTLDGNSADWQFINVRRTMTFIEQSCKLALNNFVFAPNDANTWNSVKNMISDFLTQIWKEGALQGSKASNAFDVQCGLGSTMTSEDLQNGLLRVAIKVAIVHPAEFIVLEIQQEMAAAS